MQQLSRTPIFYQAHMPITSPQDRAAESIAQAGQRCTPRRVRVLATLLAQTGVLSHHEIDAASGDPRIDKVTLYRVLDWLVEHGLAHKVVGEDRLWRFSANHTRVAAHRHAHFQCNSCERVVCLEGVPASTQIELPAGFKAEETDLIVRGVCDKCS